MKSYLKKVILRILGHFGYRISKINGLESCQNLSTPWFQHTTYPRPTSQHILDKYLGWIDNHEVVFLLGKTDLALAFLDLATARYPSKSIKVIDILRSSDDLEKDCMLPQNVLDESPDCWVLCDLENGYKHYKLLRDLGIKNILHHSLFFASPWKISDFHSDLSNLIGNMPETMIDDARLLTLTECVRYCSQLDGNMLEIGTYKGGSGFVICKTLEKLGLKTKISLIDWYEQQSASVNFDEVERVFNDFPFAELISGKAEDVIPEQEPDPLSFVHIDVNADESFVKHVLPVLYMRLQKSGMMLFDNYYFRFFCKYNFDQFADSVGERIILLPSIPQGLLIKSR